MGVLWPGVCLAPAQTRTLHALFWAVPGWGPRYVLRTVPAPSKTREPRQTARFPSRPSATLRTRYLRTAGIDSVGLWLPSQGSAHLSKRGRCPAPAAGRTAPACCAEAVVADYYPSGLPGRRTLLCAGGTVLATQPGRGRGDPAGRRPRCCRAGGVRQAWLGWAALQLHGTAHNGTKRTASQSAERRLGKP